MPRGLKQMTDCPWQSSQSLAEVRGYFPRAAKDKVATERTQVLGENGWESMRSVPHATLEGADQRPPGEVKAKVRSPLCTFSLKNMLEERVLNVYTGKK